MKFVPFEQQNATIAKDQPEYQPIPVYHNPEIEGHPHVMCIEMDEQEHAEYLRTGRFYFVLYLGAVQVFPPIGPSTLNPFDFDLLGNEISSAEKKRREFNTRASELKNNIQKIVRGLSLDVNEQRALSQLFLTIGFQGFVSKNDIRAMVSLGLPMYNHLAMVLECKPDDIFKLADKREIKSLHVIEAVNKMTGEEGPFYAC
jgi:hypothetical protein